MADSVLKASIFQRLHPRAYLERFVAEDIRPDGRPFDAWRDVSVNVGRHESALSAFANRNCLQARSQPPMALL
jgi:exosome complex RNA-binding protein Rrp42 (RNase PH superfamily)